MKKATAVFTTVLAETSPQALPLGAACVASSVKNSALTKDTFAVYLLDFSREDERFFNGGAQKIADEILSKKPFAVCFSIYVWNREILSKVCAKIKKINPSVFCIAGGPEATAAPLSMEGFDFAVCGAGEVAVPELLSALLENRDFANQIQGVYVPCENASIQPVRAVSPKSEDSPSPYLDGTIDAAKYGGALWELARGCPFKCAYCYESKGEKKIQYFPIERLEKELELFREKKIAQVFVLDPTYNADKKRALEMLNLIKKLLF